MLYVPAGRLQTPSLAQVTSKLFVKVMTPFTAYVVMVTSVQVHEAAVQLQVALSDPA